MRKIGAVLFILILFNVVFFKGFGNNIYLTTPLFGTIGFLSWIAGFNLFLFLIYFKDQNANRLKLAIVSSIISVLMASISIFRASWIDRAYLTLGSVFFSILTTYLFALTHDVFGAISEFILMPLIVFANWVAKLWQILPEINKIKVDVGKNSFFDKFKRILVSESAASVFKGLMVTLPVIIVISVLLASADPIFSKTIKDLINIKLPQLPIGLANRFGSSLVFLFLIMPFLYMKIGTNFVSPFNAKQFQGPIIQSIILVGSIATVLGFFLLIQFRYLFTNVAETELHQFGINTYSEYVRKGFVELVAVSVIVYLAVSFSMVVYRSMGSRVLKRLNLILLGETLVFIFSIFRRVFLYSEAHGLTRVRVYGSIFLVLMIALTFVMILRHLRKLQRDWYIYEIGFLVLIILTTGFLNVDGVIAKYFHPTVNEEVDYVYISRLSPDAVDGWVDAYRHVKSDIDKLSKKPDPFSKDDARRLIYANSILENIISNYLVLTEKYGNKDEVESFKDSEFAYLLYVKKSSYGFMSANLSERFAFGTLKTAIDVRELLDLKKKSNVILNNLPQDLKFLPLDRSSDSPLLRERI